MKPTIEKRLQKLEEVHAPDETNQVVICNPTIPGDADKRAEQASALGVATIVLIPDNGRDPATP